ncbi:Alpha beta hydrolase fold protein [Lasiodiplodia theobromae]|uniref:Alpha beta hydrolase fold protein n=1 Tax=Lasiodiplodia theobromae TaxID=45133 RepID=UPI0015C2C97C|nr:Alpha beta hydrolase fold protein [Lasiodiplodia theobromae]KAF4539033.1 Alpha beta hydrolase fold protein [Lasiodiplodia theobromae]
MYDTYDEVYQLGIRDPEFSEYIKKNGLEHITNISQLPGLEAGSANDAGLDQGHIIDVPMRDGYLNPLRVHKPPTPPANGKSPLVILVYGGGFRIGDNTQMSPFARIVNRLYGATVVNLTYRLVPEHRWPTAPNDVWDNLQWIAANTDKLGADPSAGFIFGGGSAGANLVVATAHKWVEQKLEPKLTGLYVSMPVLFVEENVPAKYKDLWFAWEQNKDAFALNTAGVQGLIKEYAPDTSSPDWCPVNVENHGVGFPRTYLTVCGQDPLRDDGLVYWRLLRDRGVETKLDVAPGVPHAHVIFQGLESAQKSIFGSVHAFGWLLRDEKTPAETLKALGGGDLNQL